MTTSFMRRHQFRFATTGFTLQPPASKRDPSFTPSHLHMFIGWAPLAGQSFPNALPPNPQPPA
jgi:hypothetical protein